MPNTKSALIWITDILKKHQIPFQITGGLAAKIYGSDRPLDDIDIDIPEDKFNLIIKDVEQFITYGPNRFKSEKWDLLLMTLKYEDQAIDIGGAYDTKIFNANIRQWQSLAEDLSTAVVKDVFGMQLPIINKENLLAYKKALSREVDLLDIGAIDSNLHK